MSDLNDNPAMSEDPLSHTPSRPAPSHGGGQRGGSYADEIHSITIRAKQRTFYLDLKESSSGKFFKLSEKSRGGRKTTIMFDSEDLPEMVKAFQEMQTKI